MIAIGKDTYMEDEYIISTEYIEPTLYVTVSQTDSMNETKTYEWRLISTYNGQVEDLCDDAIFCYERDIKRELKD